MPRRNFSKNIRARRSLTISLLYALLMLRAAFDALVEFILNCLSKSLSIVSLSTFGSNERKLGTFLDQMVSPGTMYADSLKISHFH